MQIGDRKLFAILGCRLSQVPVGGRALNLADLKLIALVPMETSNREAVAKVLERAQARTGVPRQIVSDGGSDVRGGAECYIETHPGTSWVLDVVHDAANTLEHYWEQDARWLSFLRRTNETNGKIRQTKTAYLLAPVPRQKVRFMKVGISIRFATRVLRLLDAPVPTADVEARYGWLREYREDVSNWGEEHRVVQTTVEIVRRDGLSEWTRQDVEDAWGPLSDRPRLQQVAGRMRAYLNVQTRRVRAGETLVGSTEALESAFGKLKRLEGDQSTGGLTGLVLALGAMVSEWEEEDIREALEAVPEKEARGWVGRNIGESVQWLRRKIFAQPKAEPKAG